MSAVDAEPKYVTSGLVRLTRPQLIGTLLRKFNAITGLSSCSDPSKLH